MEGRNPDKFKLSEMALRIFKDLYTFSDETVTDAYQRVASEFSSGKIVDGVDFDVSIAYDLLSRNMWRPNTPVWFSAGTKSKVFSACYVVSLEDSMNGIYDVANVARKIFQKGAGIGIPIGNLREKDALIYEGKKEDTVNGKVPVPVGKSSGPISFMHLYDSVGATTKSGGRARRAAIMVVMPVHHPDIVEFIQCKEVDGRLANMNISVAITDKFMQSFKDNIPFQLVSPGSTDVVSEIPARQLWDNIVDSAWKTADPGIIFIDTVNKYNTLKKLFPIESCNPCITGDAIVHTNFGKIAVSELVDKFDGSGSTTIMSYDSEQNINTWDTVQWCGVTKRNVEIIELELEDGTTLKLTPDHKVFTENRGYVEASELNLDDIILQLKYN